MPHLSIFAACEKVIIDQAGVASLITLFGKITISLPPEALEMPPNAVTPREWTIYSLWEWDPEDQGKRFSQHLEIRWPNGTVLVEKRDELVRVADRRSTQIVSPIAGFPIGEPGMISIHLRLEQDETPVFEAAPIHIEVVHTPRPAQ